MQPIDVSPTNLDTVRQILQQHVPKVEVRAFGSRVGWMARETSDLDLALMTDEPLPIGQVVALKAAFTKSNLPFRVDIVDWASTSENFRHVIKRDYVVLVVAGEAFEGGRLGLASEWRETALGSITKFLSGGTPSKRNPAYWNGSVPWVSAKDMKRFRLCDTEDHVTTEGVVNGTKLIPPGTVLLLTRGMRLLKELPVCVTERPMTFNQDIKALCPAPDINRDFFPYLVLGNRHRLQSLVDLAGHGTGRLNSDELKAFEVSLPPLREQRAIAHILGTLDDKIELNRRMNETLEAMARALFKSWLTPRWARYRRDGRWSRLTESHGSRTDSRFRGSVRDRTKIDCQWSRLLKCGRAKRIAGSGQAQPSSRSASSRTAMSYSLGQEAFWS